MDAEAMAPALIGRVLVHVVDGERRSGVIVETEAYCGAGDDCSHAFGGRRTDRTEPMFGAPGLAYVYLSYGIHRCMNVVCGREGEASAVLLRALEPVEGAGAMRAAREKPGARRAMKEIDLCSGPGKLGEAMGLGLGHSGEDMTSSGRLWLEAGAPVSAGELVNTARVGMNGRASWAARPLRWALRGNGHVSRGRPFNPSAAAGR